MEKSIDRVFNVTVDNKSENHPFFEKGSSMAYVIDGVSGKTLYLIRGRTYKFNVNAPGHPFYFTRDSTGGPGFPGSLMGDVKPTDSGTIIYNVPNDFPSSSFYQCGAHPKMGGYVKVRNEGIVMVPTPVLASHRMPK